jgi:hypothetical protein
VADRIQKLAEREGLARSRHNINKINGLLQARQRRVYQSYVPTSIRFLAL